VIVEEEISETAGRDRSKVVEKGLFPEIVRAKVAKEWRRSATVAKKFSRESGL
jgi:hypothetical protein